MISDTDINVIGDTDSNVIFKKEVSFMTSSLTRPRDYKPQKAHKNKCPKSCNQGVQL